MCNLRANCCQEFITILVCCCPIPHTEWKGVVESEFVHHTKQLDNLHWAVPKQHENNNNNNTQSCINKVVLGRMELTSQRDYVPICKA